MSTARARHSIPRCAGALILVFGAGLAACGSDEEILTSTTADSVVSTPPASAPTDPSATTAAAPAATESVAPQSTAPASTDAPAPAAVSISVTVGVDSGPERVDSVPLGSLVTITLLNPDSPDEFHLHGYDLGDGQEIPAGQPASFTFVADTAGRFELESHDTHDVIVTLDVA